MKAAGIVAEYNPFHRGHEYHIEETRRMTGADFIIVVMSGDFVQRGMPAIFPKHDRARMALKGGADLVLELPVSYATASAEGFAYGAVSILDSLGVVDFLSCGCETGDTDALEKIAEILSDEPAEYQKLLRQGLKSGMNFPAAREKALYQCTLTCPDYKIHKILGQPNNILAIEYRKAIKKLNSEILPVSVLRKGAAYHEEALDTEGYSSATAIRTKILDSVCTGNDLPDIDSDYKEIIDAGRWIAPGDLDGIIRYKLLSVTEEELNTYADMSSELARRIIKTGNMYRGFLQYADLLHTKDMTESRAYRALLHMVLGIPHRFRSRDGRNRYPDIPCARVLGMKKEAGELLKEIRKRGRISLITRPAADIDKQSIWGRELMNETTYASNVYSGLLNTERGLPFVHDYSKEIIIL